jgi:hypothetical protein
MGSDPVIVARNLDEFLHLWYAFQLLGRHRDSVDHLAGRNRGTRTSDDDFAAGGVQAWTSSII